MTFREIFRFEFAYQVRRAPVWLFFAALLAFAFIVIRVAFMPEARSNGSFMNTPYVIAVLTLFSTLIWLLGGATVAGDAATRDVETRMYPLTYTAPVGKGSYLGGRFLAALILNALILLAVPAGILLAVYLPGVDAGLIGPFNPAAYLTAYVYLALPNAFVATAIQFSWATLDRRSIAGYIAAVFIFMTSHFIVGVLGNLFDQPDITRLLDLVGLIGIADGLLDTWAPAERNTRLISLEGELLANRLIWVGVGLGVLIVTYLRFQFEHYTAGSRWGWLKLRKPSRSFSLEGKVTASVPIPIPQVPRRFSFATFTRQTLTIAWNSFAKIAKSRGGLSLVAILVVPTALASSQFMRFMDVPMLPDTGDVLRLLAPPMTAYRTPWVIIPLLIVFYAGELLWREREAGLSEIVDTAPVPEWALFLGKFLGLGIIITAWLAFIMASGLLTQLSLGYSNFELGLYIKVLFGFQLLNYLLLALLILVVHVIVDQKYLGHLVALIAFGLIAFAPRLGIGDKLFIYASDPGWTYTDMRGFEPFLMPWIWFKLYWTAWALLLAVAARLLWARGKERSLKSRIRLVRHRFTRPTALAATVAAGLILITGGFIFYHTNILNKYESTSEATERTVGYERLYGQYANIVQPQLTGIKLHVEIYPRRREAEIRGTYVFVNSSNVAIDSIHVGTGSKVETSAITFDRPFGQVLADEDLGYRIYALQQPLQPGDSLRLNFGVHFKAQGFSTDASIAANGSYFSNRGRDWLPTIGYQSDREITNPADRRTYGLSPRPNVRSLEYVKANPDKFKAEWITFEAIVGTDEDQTAVAPGLLQQTWTASTGPGRARRRYFRYVTNAPIQNSYAFFSARYAVREEKHHNVLIQIFHHPAHSLNLDRTLRSVRASLDYYTRAFGPYPYNVLKIIERPGHGMGMHAEASLIDYEEGFARINPDGNRQGGLDLPFFVVAHEMAHQWWGAAQFAPAPVEGGGLLAEGFATYSAMQVIEESGGPEQLRQYLEQVRKAYEVPRSRAAPPLIRANNPYLYYRKGPFALYALQAYIGKEQVNAALRSLFEKHGQGTVPQPTSPDLYRELRAVTPDSLRYLLYDLFEVNTFWELKTDQAIAVQTGSGNWQVALGVEARKVVVNTAGIETLVPMNDWVEIGVFAGEGDDSGKPLYRQKHRIRSGKQTIMITVPDKPARAGIDPNHLLIDLDMDDNIGKVKVRD